MLEIQKVRDSAESLAQALQKRHFEGANTQIQEVLAADERRRAIVTETESLRAAMNQESKRIGELFKSGQKEEAEAARERANDLKTRIQQGQEQVTEIETELRSLLLNIPNAPHASVPAGKGEADNQEIFRSTEDLPTGGKPHWELTEAHDIIDFELGAKITGSGFPVYKGKGARLVRGLIQFFLDEADKAGYREVIPPLLVNEDSGYGTGQLPDKEGQMYHVTGDNLYLIPTAEVPITNLFRDEILAGDSLPIRYCGYTPCFRREAGAYGKDVRGLNRLHQFDKVEIVEVAHPDESYDRLEEMLAHSRGLLEKLELPYRVLLLCGGDMGFTSAKTYDLEVFSGAQERWLEVSSVSNFETYQANRLKLRFRDENGKPHLAHTLNGSALALPRVMAALIENGQTAEGKIRMPKALHSYLGFEEIG